MRKIAFTALVAIVASTSLADARPNTLTMSCAQAAATVARAGAIVLSTGVHTYDRFVANNSFCIPGQDVLAAQAPTADNPRCTIGYTCIERYRYNREF